MPPRAVEESVRSLPESKLLRAELRGPVITPQDAEYDEVRKL